MRAASDSAPDRRLQGLLESFSIDPTDTPAFKTLEEELFVTGCWSQLAGVYECRISALEDDTAERSDLLLRLADLLHQRLDAPGAARRRYEELLHADPTHTGGLASLRRLLAETGELTSALVIAELEEGLDRPPLERARSLAEIGELWRTLGDAAEARTRFDEALRLDAGSDGALTGLAWLAEDAGDPAEAIRLHELRIEGLRGSARIDAMDRLSRLLPASEPERVRTLLREIVREQPEHRDALERLIEIERSAGAWDRVDELCRSLWDTLRDDGERAHLALRAATDQLEDAGELDAALRWADAAAGVTPDDAQVHHLRSRIHRRAGHIPGVVASLQELERIEGASSMRSLEIAVLYERGGRVDRAIAVLRALIERDPEEHEALDVLDRCLARAGRHDERRDVLLRRVELAPSPADIAELATALGDLQRDDLHSSNQAEQAYRRALSAVPDHRPATEALEGLLRDEGRFTELADVLESAADRTPPGPPRARLYCELGAIQLEEVSDPEASRHSYLLALECDPECRPAVKGLRAVAAQAGDVSALLEACERELALEPVVDRRCELLWDIVNAAREAHDLPRARHAAEQWSELQPVPPAFEALAELGRAMGDADGERGALEGLEAVLLEDPVARSACLERLGDLALSQPDPAALEHAAHWYGQALELDPRSEVRRKAIDLYRRSGQLPELVEQLREEIAQASPEQARDLRIELARTLAGMGDFAGATEAALPCLDANPADAEPADLVEGLLAEQNRLEELTEVLGRRLARDRDPARRRELALRQGELLIDGLGRPADAVAVLRELADPSRQARLEQVFERALDAAGSTAAREHETWLAMRESHVDGSERLDLLLRLATLRRDAGQIEGSIEALRRAERLVPPDRPDLVRRPLLSLLREQGDPEAQLALLEKLLDDAADAAARAAFHIERARILVDDLDRRDEAMAELQGLEDVPLQPGELRLLGALYGRASAPVPQADALRALADATPDPEERIRVLFELASLQADGPEEVRDEERAAAILEELLASESCGRRAFERLTALLERRGQTQDLVRILGQRLELPELSSGARTALTNRLARLLGELGRVDEAARILAEARDSGIPDPAIDELLYRMLELAGDLERSAELCQQKSHDEAGDERGRWLRRWLGALERRGEPPEAMLEVVDQLLAQDPTDAELVGLRIPLLRSLGRVGTLAEGLEEVLAQDIQLSDGRRRILVRELLRLYEGPLEDPERALRLIEREVEGDDSLRLRGANLAAKLGDVRREIALLAPRVASAAAPSPSDARRLGLGLAALGDEDEAEPLLWQALEFHRRDREVLTALARMMRRRDDLPAVLRLLETQFAVEVAEDRLLIAREGAELGTRAEDTEAELTWLRRWHALDGLPAERLGRWLELERESGRRSGILEALAAVREATEAPEEQAHLLAEEAAIQMSAGQLDLARAQYEEALERIPSPPVEWLAALDRVLVAQGKDTDRAPVLRELSRHPSLSAQERVAHHEARVGLLSAHPEMRHEAALELELLIEADQQATHGTRIQRMRELLRLYDTLECQIEWCELAEQLLGLLDSPDQHELQRELARRLGEVVLAPERAIGHWQGILDDAPDDLEALAAMAELLRAPGAETRRVEVLERYAGAGALTAHEVWLEAAALRWNVLRDADTALVDVERALALRPDWPAGHAIRQEVCAQIGREEAELESLRILLDGAHPDRISGERWLRLATLLSWRDGDAVEAREAATRALEANPSGEGVRASVRAIFEQAGGFERAAELLREEIEDSEPAMRAGLLRRLARIEWEELQQADAAGETLDALAQSDALEPEDRERWAEIFESRECWLEAVTQRRHALAARGDLAGAVDWLDLARRIVDRTDRLEPAREACDEALRRDPHLHEALELRADLLGRLGEHEGRLEDLVRLAEHADDRARAAASLACAGAIAQEHLGDETRAWALFRKALKLDASHVEALLGAGGIAARRGEWPESERMFGLACSLLSASGESRQLAHSARRAAHAALEQGRNAEAFRYLEISLEREPDEPEALDAMADLSLRLGAWGRARTCILARLDAGDIEPGERADRMFHLAQACEGEGDLLAAAAHLEQVVALRPQDEVSRARVVDLLEQQGEVGRAIEQLEAWSRIAAPEFRPGLTLRTARLEARSGRRPEARLRLESLVEDGPAPGDAWIELAELALGDEGSTGALGIAERGLRCVEKGAGRAPLLWIQARALYELGRIEDATRRACDTLKEDPTNVDAACLLAGHLGQSGDFREAVTQLERLLDEVHPAKPIESQLWEAIGRAYAGPLENIERAQLAYRRSLEANPLRSSAREALADITAFDPGSHRESVELHRDLLEAFPARAGSWRAIQRMAGHWMRTSAEETCARVLAAVGAAPGPSGTAGEGPLLIAAGASENTAVRVATELLLALEDAEALPTPGHSSGLPDLPDVLRTRILRLAGGAWELHDDQLRVIWSEPVDDVLQVGDRVSRRALRPLRKALRSLESNSLTQLEPEVWREELLAEAAASAIGEGQLEIDEALRQLLALWPATSHLDLGSGGDVGAALQLCPPARALLLRVASSTLAALGV